MATSAAWANDPEPVPPIPVVNVGDSIINPDTGETEVITFVLNEAVVITEAGNVIMRAFAVGQTYTYEERDPETNALESSTTYVVTSLVKDADDNIIEVIVADASLDPATAPSHTLPLVYNPAHNPNNPYDPDPSTDGSGATDVDFSPATGDINQVTQSKRGGNGSNGSDGYGIRMCFGIFGCVTVGKSPSKGGDGGAGPTINHVVDNTNGNIETISDGLPGIVASSIGGNGGKGGDGWGNLAGATGGKAGVGGHVTLENHVNVSTSGDKSHGIFAQSRSGTGGKGGTGFILGEGGSGGSASQGGQVEVYNYGDIYTTGDESIGILAQSLAGSAGSGGSSYGVVGQPGYGSTGGNGGEVSVEHYGAIVTEGKDAHGIQAQSIGGSGGNAGSAGGVATFGEEGAAGGHGGNVTVTTGSDAFIGTKGEGSHAIFAQSIGGGGGSGSSSSSLVAFGSAGGSGGDGGTVTVENAGTIITEGVNARGILAQSIGGGGGSGGNASGVAAVGGQGGGASKSDTVTVTNSGTIQTEGNRSDAIFAQSVGGGGGDAGSGGGVFLTIGGNGGDGGDGGIVTIGHSGNIITTGDDARGIFAQSVGGGGGNGGNAVSGSIFAGVAIGGAGGKGGDAKEASVDFTPPPGGGLSTISTAGDRSTGVMVQSIGGGGGNGGFSVQASVGYGASASVSIGGSGGDGGDGGVANLTGQANIETGGDYANGILVQSVGGGGGNGGNAMSFSFAAGETAAAAFGAALGGSGGGGGHGKEVTVDSGGSIDTYGAFSTGLLAQSVGGGGGNGGLSMAITGAGAGAASAAASVGIGGSGGDGGDGGNVEVVYDGDITTHCNANAPEDCSDSAGAVIQSVGGGGGNGGYNISASAAFAGKAAGAINVGLGGNGGGGGKAGTVDGTLLGHIETFGDRSGGAIIQSVGGGGGSGGFNISAGIAGAKTGAGALSVGIGGAGGDGGDGGDVFAKAASIITHGAQSTAFLAQSVGGGGGAGGMNISGGVAVSKEASGTMMIGIGGAGGGGGNAKTVTAEVKGLIGTLGAQSNGVIVQSIGGGGGAGGMNISGGVAASKEASGTLGVGIGGFGGSGGDGGDVTLTRTGDTYTEGVSSDAIIVQSVGGGGGNGGMNITGNVAIGLNDTAAGAAFGLGGFGGDGGDAGAVSADITGHVVASGLESDTTGVDDDGNARRYRKGGSSAVIVQSIGGGGGNGGTNISGQVSVGKPGAEGSTAYSASIGIGGFGGGGGNAQDASLNIHSTPENRSIISSIGDDQKAVLIQSVGGGGGNGGINISTGLSLDGTLAVGIGGFGGDGGLGRAVKSTIDADLYAAGERSRALLAQSIGGGGGSGGVNISGAYTHNTTGHSPAVTFGLGGAGGSGSASGDVDVTQSGFVSVEGRDSIAMLVQSVGGGGGDGGLNISAGGTTTNKGIVTSVGIGGSGGAGADAGNVTFRSSGDVLVNAQEISGTAGEYESTGYDENAAGIIVQSIGGGGGAGSMNVTGAYAPKGNPFMASVGGSGDTGGNAGTVQLTRGYVNDGSGEVAAPGTLMIFGDNAKGILAQSVGGGGGLAGISSVMAYATGKDAYSAVANIGGDGANAGHGNTVDVRHAGNIYTFGRGSDALVAQSIGGGGGDANYTLGFGMLKGATNMNVTVGGGTGSGGEGKAVTLDHDGHIRTEGNDSRGILAQSIGGGGGNTKMSKTHSQSASHEVGIAIGRKGGSGGKADAVTVTTKGRIETLGENAVAIHAQSIGGGGGTSSSTSVSAGTTTSQKEESKASVSIGVEGGSGAEGGAVIVDSEAVISTEGDNATGILAQSIGGGGGTGGSTNSMALGKKVAASVSVGGDGGTGAIADDVTVTNRGDISTAGYRADGVHAQSIGGGGGMGGMARQLTTVTSADSTSYNMQVNVGGTGGTGAASGAVDILNAGTIYTTGDSSYGIRAQAIGGGGGIGGAVAKVAMLKSQQANQSFDLAIGGAGGDGANADAVNVINEGLIYTTGRGSAGIGANSIGGGGGDAGIIMELTAGFTGSGQTNRFTLNYGRTGGTGGTGGAVSVINRAIAGVTGSGTIVTEGDDAYGIFAQSLGGGGGNGSSIVSVAGMKTGAESTVVGLNIGGTGGSGDNGGSVTVENHGVIDTSGQNAHGIFAQSVGGGGGNGGMAITANIMISQDGLSPLVSLGGGGGNGGDGGNVHVINNGAIVTRGDKSHGILAQSIGGGGGNANLGFSATLEAGTLVLSNALSAAVGALTGGTGGTGGAVKVEHHGDIVLFGKDSQGIIAQSINGGGGNIQLDLDGIATLPGVSYVGGSPSPTGSDPSIAAQLGGYDGDNMNAGSVEVITTGNIILAGENSIGQLSQSIGGGGGTFNLRATLTEYEDPNAVSPFSMPLMAKSGFSTMSTPTAEALELSGRLGDSGGNNNTGGVINNSHSGDFTMAAAHSRALIQQSIGSGGGISTLSLSAPASTAIGDFTLEMGSDGSTNGSADDVDFAYDGNILMLGDNSAGATFQSIGGGGGFASLQLSGAEAASARMLATLGAENGSSHHAGDITVTTQGNIESYGANSLAIIAQSIGGGGGVTFAGDSAVESNFGGSGGTSGDAGDITLTNIGTLYSEGAQAHGVFLQSIGGGGGAVLGSGVMTIGSNNTDNSGDGGVITFNQQGDIILYGDGAHGIVAQSLGGGGGWQNGFAGSAGGAGAGDDITLDVDGEVWTMGADAYGIFAQSTGTSGAGDMHITLHNTVMGGSGSGAGVMLDGGANNTLTNHELLAAASGTAITASDGNDNIVNHGVIVGDVNLGGGHNSFTNAAGGSYLSSSDMILHQGPGSSGTFINSGEFRMGLDAPLMPVNLAAGETFDSFGGFRTMAVAPSPSSLSKVVNTVNLVGNFTQTAAGHLAFDVAFGPYASDRVNVTGDATVDGTGAITLMWLENTAPVTLYATGGIGIDNGLQLEDTLAIDYSVLANADGVHVTFQHDFEQPFLNANGRAMARYMNTAIAQGGASGIGQMAAYLGNLKAGQQALYTSLFTAMDAEPYVIPLAMQMQSADRFSRNMFNCRQPGEKSDTACSRVSVDHLQFDRDGTADYLSVDAGTTQVGNFFELPINEDTAIVGAFGYESVGKIRVDQTRSTTRGHGVNAGVGVKWTGLEGYDFGVSMAGGWKWLDTNRSFNVFQPDSAEAQHNTQFIQTGARVGHTWQGDMFFARLGSSLSFTTLRQSNFSEKGVGSMGLRGMDDTQSLTTFSPELTIGTQWQNGAGMQGVTSLRLGSTHHSTDHLDMPYQFVSSPHGSPIIYSTPLDQNTYHVGMGLDVWSNEAFGVQMNYDHSFGDTMDTSTASFQLKMRF